jgi:hypothetical protein
VNKQYKKTAVDSLKICNSINVSLTVKNKIPVDSKILSAVTSQLNVWMSISLNKESLCLGAFGLKALSNSRTRTHSCYIYICKVRVSKLFTLLLALLEWVRKRTGW